MLRQPHIALTYLERHLYSVSILEMFVSMKTPRPHVNNGTAAISKGIFFKVLVNNAFSHYNTTGTQSMKMPGNWKSYACIANEF